MADVYQLPQVLVYQVLNPQVSLVERRAHACYIGGLAELVRFTEADEKEKGKLEEYAHGLDTCYPWPNLTAGSVIDPTYAKLFVKSGMLRYLSRGSGASPAPTLISGNRNKFDLGINLVDKVGYARHTSLNDRDVKVGDGVRIRATHSGNDYTLEGYITALEAEMTAAVVGAISINAGNQATIASADPPVVTKIGGPDNCIALTASSASWKGIRGARAAETYTVTVIQDSVGGDLTTARLRITSDSGYDEVATVAPNADGVAKLVTPLGLSLTFSYDASSVCEDAAEAAGITADDLVKGMQWTVEVEMAFTSGTLTTHVSSTYTHEEDTTYIIEIVRGGTVGGDVNDPVKFRVTTNTGVDYADPVEVLLTNTAYPVGTKGVKVQFNTAGTHTYCRGDRFFIEATASAPGAVQIIKTSRNLSSVVPGGTAVNVELFIRGDFEIPLLRDGASNIPNFDVQQDELCVFADIEMYHPEWTSAGVPVAIPLLGGTLYAHYRAWVQTFVNEVNSFYTNADVEALPGPNHPDNPMKYALGLGVGAAQGVQVMAICVADPNDVDSWDEAFSKLTERMDIHGLVALTNDKAVLASLQSHVNSMSSPENAGWRTMWMALPSYEQAVMLDQESSTDGELVLAVIEEDPENSGEYTYVVVPDANADFITKGIRSGDIVRTNYQPDGQGGIEYTSYVIDEVISEDTVKIKDGPLTAQALAVKMEVWRNTTPAEEAEYVATVAMTPYAGNRRVRCIWPDRLGAAGRTVDGYFAAATLAALASAAFPHQGLTGSILTGFDNVDRTVKRFGRDQLNQMALNGVWILTKDPGSAAIYTRHALTAGAYNDPNEREEQVTRNLDLMSYDERTIHKDLIGKANVVPTLFDIIRERHAFLKKKFTGVLGGNMLGPRALSYEIESLAADPVQRDAIIKVVAVELPYPFNVARIYQSVK